MTDRKPLFKQVQTPQGKEKAPSAGAEVGTNATDKPARSGDGVTVEAQLDPRAAAEDLPQEVGGYDGPEPTRFGDWEHKGRCTDF